MPAVNLAVSIPSLVGSIVSLLASSTFAVLYFLFPPKRHFRQYLVINLLVADWINSLNNSVSGIAVLSDYKNKAGLDRGPACTANAYIGQFSVQAIDFNILVISVSVLLTVRKQHIVAEQSWKKLTLACIIPWIMPVITSNIALALGLYGPVSGNWCWITADHFGLRYALTHGWRIAIFASTLVIYTCVYIILKRQYGRVLGLAGSSGGSQVSTTSSNSGGPRNHTELGVVRSQASAMPDLDIEREPLHHASTDIAAKTVITIHDRRLTPVSTHSSSIHSKPINPATPLPKLPLKPNPAHPDRQIRKMLLLNGYPILYIMLWIPGITNRIWESFGPSPTWLQGLQATTQFMGFADVVTYAYNEQFYQQVRRHFEAKRGFRRSSE